ncbi:hypothetical protein DT87_00035 [Streptomyces sp. NTK 937]|nr:hypothetical protein DT87_00035 [Streptomyces sp. NTK 937]
MLLPEALSSGRDRRASADVGSAVSANPVGSGGARGSEVLQQRVCVRLQLLLRGALETRGLRGGEALRDGDFEKQRPTDRCVGLRASGSGGCLCGRLLGLDPLGLGEVGAWRLFSSSSAWRSRSSSVASGAAFEAASCLRAWCFQYATWCSGVMSAVGVLSG